MASDSGLLATLSMRSAATTVAVVVFAESTVAAVVAGARIPPRHVLAVTEAVSEASAAVAASVATWILPRDQAAVEMPADRRRW